MRGRNLLKGGEFFFLWEEGEERREENGRRELN